MNYKVIYDALIERSRQRELKDVYFEKHHILPKCMGGSNKKDNLVKLLAREHFIAHELLVKIYPNESKLIYALHMMCIQDRYGMTNKKYELIRKKFAKNVSKQMKGRVSPTKGKTAWNKGKTNIEIYGAKKAEEIKQTAIKNHKDMKGSNNPMFGIPSPNLGKIFSEEHRKNISKGLTGKHPSEESRRKMSESHKGVKKVFSEENKRSKENLYDK